MSINGSKIMSNVMYQNYGTNKMYAESYCGEKMPQINNVSVKKKQ